MCKSMHLYSSRSSFLSDCSSFSALFFSYSNSAVKEYYNRIHSYINHLTSLAASLRSLISSLISSYLVHEFHRIILCSANLLQCAITCSAVSLIWSHEQTDNEKPRTWVLFRKAASLLQLIWICMIIKLSVFCSCTCSLTAFWLRNLISRKFYLRDLSVQQCFYLCSNAWSANTFILFSNLSQCSAH